MALPQSLADGKLKSGTIVDFVAMTGAKTLVPLCFGHVATEDRTGCEWTFREFRKAVEGSPLLTATGQRRTMFMADLGGGLAEAFAAVFPEFTLGTCVQHRKVRSGVNGRGTHSSCKRTLLHCITSIPSLSLS